MLEKLPKLLGDVLETFGTARAEDFKGNPWRRWLEEASTNALLEFAQSEGLYLKVGSGDGAWPEIPWVGLGSKKLAQSSQRGMYLAFLFNSKLDGFSLSMQQGIGEMRDAIGIKRSRPILRERATMVRARKSPPERFALRAIDLGASERRGRLYQVAHVCGRAYSKEILNADIVADLRELVTYYLSLAEDQYIVTALNSIPSLGELFPDLDRDSETLSEADYRKKYASLIADIAAEAELDDDDVLGGTPTSKVLVSRRIGQEGLRKALLGLYEPVCAACGNVVATSVSKFSKVRLSLHAAHIVAVEHGGRTRIYNGLLLCPNHHWSFDNHCWWIEADGQLTVRKDLKGNPLVAGLVGRTLLTPYADWAKPKPKAIAHHRKKAQAIEQRLHQQ